MEEFVYELSEYKDWEFVKNINEFRVIKNGTTHIALSVVSSIPSRGEEYNGETEVRIVVKGYLYFDGFRHLYFSGKDGYMYYQNTGNLIELLKYFDDINKSCKEYN